MLSQKRILSVYWSLTFSLVRSSGKRVFVFVRFRRHQAPGSMSLNLLCRSRPRDLWSCSAWLMQCISPLITLGVP